MLFKTKTGEKEMPKQNVCIGDVRQLKDSTLKFIVENIEEKVNRKFSWVYCTVDGVHTERLWLMTVEKESTLLAHYDSVQEALVSKEFTKNVTLQNA